MHTSLHNLNLKKEERLKSEKLIDRLFRQGKSKSHGCIRLVYLYTDEEFPVAFQVMFSVPKKNFKRAIIRNLLKRRMREVYRLNKSESILTFADKKIKVLLAFLYIDSEVKSYSEIEKSIKYLLHSLIK